MLIFNMTNPNKDTITVHCIVERILDPLSALVQQTTTSTRNSANDETMELNNSLNNVDKTSSDQPSTHLLCDLLQSYTNKDQSNDSRDKSELKNELKTQLSNQLNTHQMKSEEDEDNKANDNRDDRPHHSPKQQESNQMETDQDSAIKEENSPTTKFLNSTAKKTTIVKFK